MKKVKPQQVIDGPDRAATGMIHYVSRPTTSGPHPTVVMLHGRFGNEKVMWVFQRTIPAHWLVLAPRAIKADPRGGFTWTVDDGNPWPSLAAFNEAVTAVANFLHALPAVYEGDPQKTYLMGFSQGAAVAYATAMRHPGLVQGVAGLVGFIPQDCDTHNLSALRDLPIFMAVGKKDPLIPYEKALNCAQMLREAGAALEYQEYDTGHKLNAQGMRDLAKWLATRDEKRASS